MAPRFFKPVGRRKGDDERGERAAAALPPGAAAAAPAAAAAAVAAEVGSVSLQGRGGDGGGDGDSLRTPDKSSPSCEIRAGFALQIPFNERDEVDGRASKDKGVRVIQRARGVDMC